MAEREVLLSCFGVRPPKRFGIREIPRDEEAILAKRSLRNLPPGRLATTLKPCDTSGLLAELDARGLQVDDMHVQLVTREAKTTPVFRCSFGVVKAPRTPDSHLGFQTWLEKLFRRSWASGQIWINHDLVSINVVGNTRDAAVEPLVLEQIFASDPSVPAS